MCCPASDAESATRRKTGPRTSLPHAQPPAAQPPEPAHGSAHLRAAHGVEPVAAAAQLRGKALHDLHVAVARPLLWQAHMEGRGRWVSLTASASCGCDRAGGPARMPGVDWHATQGSSNQHISARH